MKWKVAGGAVLGAGAGIGITALHALRELATDPTAPGGRLAGMEKNFPGNNLYVVVDVFWSAIPFILLAGLAGGLAARVLFAVIQRVRNTRGVVP
jgi:hypothetical protein